MKSVVRDPGWFIVVNPASGGGRARRRWPELAAELRSRDIPHRAVVTESPGHAVALIAGATVAGERNLLAVGGGGSFHELVNGIVAQTTVPAAELVACVAPFGSGNDWARNLRVPRDPAGGS